MEASISSHPPPLFPSRNTYERRSRSHSRNRYPKKLARETKLPSLLSNKTRPLLDAYINFFPLFFSLLHRDVASKFAWRDTRKGGDYPRLFPILSGDSRFRWIISFDLSFIFPLRNWQKEGEVKGNGGERFFSRLGDKNNFVMLGLIRYFVAAVLEC